MLDTPIYTGESCLPGDVLDPAFMEPIKDSIPKLECIADGLKRLTGDGSVDRFFLGP